MWSTLKIKWRKFLSKYCFVTILISVAHFFTVCRCIAAAPDGNVTT